MNSMQIYNRRSPSGNFLELNQTQPESSHQAQNASLINSIAIKLLNGFSYLVRYFRERLITRIDKKIENLDIQIQKQQGKLKAHDRIDPKLQNEQVPLLLRSICKQKIENLTQKKASYEHQKLQIKPT